MAAAETARLIASLELKDNFSGTANKAMKSLGKLESTGFRVGQNIGKGLNNAATNLSRIGLIVGGAAVAGIAKSVQAASNLEQAVGAVDSVYGKSAKTIEAWGNTAAEAAGLSKREVNEMAAVTGAQLQGMGFETEEAAKQAIVLQKRAADLAATFGGPTVDAMAAISSLMRGERDPIERYGVSIKSVDVNARIAAKGLDTSTAAAKKNAEAIAGMELLMEQTAKTQGQFAREADGLAGSQARLRANLENTGAIIGKTLLPQLAKLTGRFNDLLVANQPAIAKFAEQLPAVFDQILAAVERIPWESIGTSLKIAGIGAKALLDAFLGLPPWVQTAVITGWGLNKLTGGALGGIVSELGKGLIKGVLGMNAGVVNLTAATVNGVPTGGTGPGGGGKFGFLGNALKVTVIGAVAVAGLEAALSLIGVNDPRHQLDTPVNRFGGTTFRGTNVIAEQIAHLENSLPNLVERAAKGDTFAAKQLEDIRAEIAKLRDQVKANAEVFGPPTPANLKNRTTDSGGRGIRQKVDESAILQRALAKGFKPTDAAVQATLQRNIIREQEKTKAAVDAVKQQEARTTAAVLVAAAAIGNLDRQQPVPQVSTFTTVNVTAGGIEKKVVVQRRFGPPGGSRHKGGGPQEFD
jgi:hypothetical protein